MKNLGGQIKASDVSFTNRLQDMEEKEFQVMKTKQKQWISKKENVKSKNNPGNQRHYKNTKSTSNRNRGRRKTQVKGK